MHSNLGNSPIRVVRSLASYTSYNSVVPHRVAYPVSYIIRFEFCKPDFSSTRKVPSLSNPESQHAIMLLRYSHTRPGSLPRRVRFGLRTILPTPLFTPLLTLFGTCTSTFRESSPTEAFPHLVFGVRTPRKAVAGGGNWKLLVLLPCRSNHLTL